MSTLGLIAVHSDLRAHTLQTRVGQFGDYFAHPVHAPVDVATGYFERGRRGEIRFRGRHGYRCLTVGVSLRGGGGGGGGGGDGDGVRVGIRRVSDVRVRCLRTAFRNGVPSRRVRFRLRAGGVPFPVRVYVRPGVPFHLAGRGFDENDFVLVRLVVRPVLYADSVGRGCDRRRRRRSRSRRRSDDRRTVRFRSRRRVATEQKRKHALETVVFVVGLLRSGRRDFHAVRRPSRRRYDGAGRRLRCGIGRFYRRRRRYGIGRLHRRRRCRNSERSGDNRRMDRKRRLFGMRGQ